MKKKGRCMAIMVMLCGLFDSVKAQESKHINEVFDIAWENYVGLTSFRTNVKLHNGKLYVPSNGDERHLPGDENDGIHILDPATGKSSLMINVEGSAVEDCNGVVLTQEFLFFGNDNGQFFCYEEDGSMVWESSVQDWFKGEVGKEDDVEGVPVLADLNGDGFKDPVFNVESNGLVALNGKTGELIWSFKYVGKPGTYMNSPAAFDLNNDGVKDFIIGGMRDKDEQTAWDYRYGVHAINGVNGQVMWTYNTSSNVHASPVVLHAGNKIRIVVAESYSDILFLKPDGKLEKFINLNLPSEPYGGGISGLFSSPVFTEENHVFIGSSWWGDEDGVWQCDFSPNQFFTATDGLTELKKEARTYHQTGPVSSSAVVADILKKPKGKETIICTEKGEMLIFSSDGALLKRLKLPAGVEATPLVTDADGDGKTELIVACLDGKIYCYRTDIKAQKRIHVGGFRNDPDNTGVIPLKSL